MNVFGGPLRFEAFVAGADWPATLAALRQATREAGELREDTWYAHGGGLIETRAEQRPGGVAVRLHLVPLAVALHLAVLAVAVFAAAFISRAVGFRLAPATAGSLTLWLVLFALTRAWINFVATRRAAAIRAALGAAAVPSER